MRYLVIINHSKTMNPGMGPILPTTPRYLIEAGNLNRLLASHQDLQGLMHVSSKLLAQVKDYIKKWNPNGQGMAAWTYSGDIFKGLDAKSLNKTQSENLNQHTLILSGLYGALRPSDMISPYRLEMAARLSGEWGRNLQSFWKPKLYIERIYSNRPEVIIACASQEFMKALSLPIDSRLIVPKFYEIDQNGKTKEVTIFTKQARGLFARWCCLKQPSSVNDLRKFNLGGYKFMYEDGQSMIFGRHSG